MSWVGINPVRRPGRWALYYSMAKMWVTFWPWNSTVLTDLEI